MSAPIRQRNNSHYNLRPQYPRTIQSQNQTTSTFHSSSSVSSISSIASTSSQSSTLPSHQGSPDFSTSTWSSAPLPSPSQSPLQPQSQYFDAYMQQQQQQRQQQQPQQTQQDEAYMRQRQQSFDFQAQRGMQTNQPTTAPFLQDFSLLAEAAKRAQMACLMRDIDDMEL
ncbi:hypothetical protein MBLNU457_6893t1 [Dothideomycetes sp. NU457]